MTPLDKKQSDYLVNTLIPRAERLVLEIKKTPALLKSLIDEQLIEPSVHDAFLATLVELPARMTELVQQNKFVINDALPESRAAQASTISGKGAATVKAVELRSELLDSDAVETVLSRVRTLLHEISHTIVVNNAFPIVDYCYVGGWAISHLGPLCAENADTFAEASMVVPEDPGLKLAEPPLESSKWLFRTYNNAVAQQAALREAKAIGLSAALAWADLRVNRAWLRMADYNDFAGRRDDGTVADMRRIEEQFRTWGIVQERKGAWYDFGSGKILDEASKGAVGNVSASVNQVKNWVSGMQVRVVKDGAIDFIKGKPYRLQIPLAALSLDTPTLGSAILEKIFATLADASKLPLPITQTDLLTLCVNNDRHPEQERLEGRWKELLATPPTPPKDLDALYGLDALLALAIVDSGAVFWKNVAAKLGIPKREKYLGDASAVSTDVAEIEQKLEDLEAAIGKLQASNALRAEILDRRAKALDMLKLAIKTMADKAAVVLIADANKVKGWKDFSDRIAAIKFPG